MNNPNAELTPDKKRELLAQLLRKKMGREKALHPLSAGQRALWFHYMMSPESPVYNNMVGLRILSALDIHALESAFLALSQRHPILRTTYRQVNGEAVQEVHDDDKINFRALDVSGWPAERLNEYLLREADLPFDLEHGPMLKVRVCIQSAREHILLMIFHHISIDFWSLDILINELRLLYSNKLTGIDEALPVLTLTYADFVHAQKAMVLGKTGETHLKYWKDTLQGGPATLNLPTDRPRPSVQTYRGAIQALDIPDEMYGRLKTLANSEGKTMYVILLAAIKILLFRYSGQPDIAVGSPMVARSQPSWKNIVGFFSNPVVLRTDLSNDPPLKSFLNQVRDVVLGGIEHQDYPFSLLVERLQPARDPGRSPLFQVAFFWDKIQQSDNRYPDLRKALTKTADDALNFEPLFMNQRGVPFDLILSVMEFDQKLSASLEYNTDLFDASTIARFAGHFQILLESMVNDPDQPVSQLAITTGLERTRQLTRTNDTRCDFPEVCVHTLFEDQVNKTPQATAVLYSDISLSYDQLNRKVNQLAFYLRRLGVGPETLVGIHLNRSPDMIIGILAVLKAGGAYVPLDPAYPRERLAYIIGDTLPQLILVNEVLLENFPETKAKVISLEGQIARIETESELNPGYDVAPGNLAYVIYTSGSTGKPKGVEIEHRSVVNFLLSLQSLTGITNRDSLLSVTNLSFDIAGLELFLPLISGAAVVIAGREITNDGKQLLAKLLSSGVTFMQATPSTWRLLLEAGLERIAQLNILCGGEMLPRSLANELLGRGKSLWNLYGPTETTIWSGFHKIESTSGVVPIGRPIANTQIYLLDSNLQPVPEGVPGEIFIGGIGLARGYHNRPQLTAEKFFTVPFESIPAARLYRTGDLGRYLPAGDIEYLGRTDNQVKIRGYRIEPGEIEASLGEHPSIAECVVITREDTAGKTLVAYIQPRKELLREDPVPSIPELRAFLRRKLPEYMIPHLFIFLDAIPKTTSGKLDRGSLPAYQGSDASVARSFVAPRTKTEELLAGIYKQVLGLEEVGIHDNFFDLGGASIQTLKVTDLVSNAGIQISPELIFEYQTIAELAQKIETSSLFHAPVETGNGHFKATNIELPEIMGRTEHTGNGISHRDAMKTVIESLGIYLPARCVSTEEILDGCRNNMMFPLERMTGIKSRRIAAGDEFSIDLARKAVTDCLAKSRYQPKDIELLICCNISRYDGPHQFSFEPNTSLKLRKHFGFENAMAFDISNACTGMFTAIQLMDGFIKTGVIKRGMIVSGEYISHLTSTAQKEIEGFMDSRLACLTLGDAGAALLLEASADSDAGFQEIEMFTLGKYSSLCIAKVTNEAHGGAIMMTDPVKQTAVSIDQAVIHSAQILSKHKWEPESFQHIIMHQTSETALNEAVRAINNLYNKDVCNKDNTIYNLAERGNTATTTHFVAVKDNIINDRIRAGDRMVFAITGSGQTIGTALYTFDDLPARIRQMELNGHQAIKVPVNGQYRPAPVKYTSRIKIESIGAIDRSENKVYTAIELAKHAAENCLEKSAHDRNDIGLLIHAGLYRDEYLSEPAIAALLAGELKMNDDISAAGGTKTFAFDIFNSSMGFLNACYTAIQLIRAGKYRNAMIVASEIENNAATRPSHLLNLVETGSALILEEEKDGSSGFGNFVFSYHTEHLNALTANTNFKDGQTYLDIYKDPDLEKYFLASIPQTVDQLLEMEGLDISRVKWIFPPQISPGFISNLAAAMHISREKFVDITSDDGKDYFTSSFPLAIQYAREQKMIDKGDIGLIINVGSGIQTGCAVYYF